MKMKVKSNFKDIKSFAGLILNRNAKFKQAPSVSVPKTYAVNETAAKLHPAKQFLMVTDIIDLGSDTKAFVLTSRDGSAAYFRAGQYLSIELKIGGSVLTRPYSIASTPAMALKGQYTIAVKRVSDGFASGYILDNWSIGTEVTAFAPEGTFVYEPLRDAKTVVGIAGGSGITPFLSLAGAIADGTEDAELILLYGSRTQKDILFKEEFDRLAATCNKVKVVHVLSEEKAEGFENGFIKAELIQKYAPDNYSVFVCGPSAMYKFVGEELKRTKLPRRRIRFELFGAAKNPAALPDFPKNAVGKAFSCTVDIRGEKRSIPCQSGESLLVSLERAAVSPPSRCRSGECGFCRCKLVSGEVFIPQDTDGRRLADLKFGFIHPCSTYPVSDVELSL